MTPKRRRQVRHNVYLVTVYRSRVEAGLCRVWNCSLPPVPGYVRCEMHRIIENTQQRERRRLKKGEPMQSEEPLPLEDAKFQCLSGNKKFGDVYPKLHPDDREVFKEWWLHEPSLPVIKTTLSPTEEIISARDMGYTGDSCGKCGQMTLRRVGTCLRCDTCYSSSGCD